MCFYYILIWASLKWYHACFTPMTLLIDYFLLISSGFKSMNLHCFLPFDYLYIMTSNLVFPYSLTAIVLWLGFGYFSAKLGDCSEQGESKHDQKYFSPLALLRVYLKLVRISPAAAVSFLLTLCSCLLRSLFLRNGLCPSLCSCTFPRQCPGFASEY